MPSLRSRRAAIVVLALLLSACAGRAPPPPPPDPIDDPDDVDACAALAERLHTAFSEVGDLGGTGALAIQQGSCAAMVEVTDGIEPDDLHRIASVTKTFVAASVVSLAREDAIDLDAEARTILDDIGIDFPASITVRHLLRHQSGIPDYLGDPELVELAFADPSATWDLVDLLESGVALGSDFEPGTSWSYSNTNYLALGVILEIVTAQTWEAVVKERAIDRASLTSTFVDGFDALDDRLAPGTHDGVEATFALHPSFPASAGNMIASPADIATWVRALHGSDAILDEEGRAELLDVVDIGGGFSYGLGTMTTTVSGTELIGHNGLLPGYSGEAYYLPAVDAGIYAIVDETTGSPAFLLNTALEALQL